MSRSVTRCPPETATDLSQHSRNRANAMSNPHKSNRPPAKSPIRAEVTLAHVLEALATNQALPPTRRRDLRSAVNRVAALLSESPSNISLDLRPISAKLAAVNPIAMGLSP